MHFSQLYNYSKPNVCVIGITQAIQRRKRIVPPVSHSSVLYHIRDRLCDLVSPQMINPSNRCIDSSTYPRGSPDISIFNPSSFSYPFYFRPEGCGLRPSSLVGCCISAIENTCPSRYACACSGCQLLQLMMAFYPLAGR